MKKKVLISALLILILLSGICIAVLFNISNRISDTLVDTILLPNESGNNPAGGASLSPSDAGNAATEQGGEGSNAAGPAESSAAGQAQGGALSPQEEREKIKKSVPMTDKMFITTTVLAKLSKSELSMLMGMLQGGLTDAERQAAKKIALSRFSADELNRIYQIYYKYANSVSIS